MALPDIRAVFGRMRAWALEREPMAAEPELSPDAEPWLRAPSIEAVETEIARHVEEARTRWLLQGVTVIHRYGRLVPGDNIVLVLTASAHREAAFQAAEFLMDYLKTQAPFWKSEERADGRRWVEAQASDDDATARWTR